MSVLNGFYLGLVILVVWAVGMLFLAQWIAKHSNESDIESEK